MDKSGYGADRFAMVANEDGTGSLIITQPLDYEDPLQRNGFRFQIQVVDKVRQEINGNSSVKIETPLTIIPVLTE